TCSSLFTVRLPLPPRSTLFPYTTLFRSIRASLALHCNVQESSRFARKNYFYPDLPKGYQISMYELPLATGGWQFIHRNLVALGRSEEHTSELQSRENLVCRLLLEKKNQQ